MKKLLPLFVFFIFAQVQAQDSTNKNTRFITKTTFGPFKIDGKIISGKLLREEIKRVPSAIPYFKKATTNAWVSLISLLGGLSCFVLSTPEKDNPNKKLNNWIIPAVTLYGNGIFFIFRSTRSTKIAIKKHNEGLKNTY